jgi:hypothetical protein
MSAADRNNDVSTGFPVFDWAVRIGQQIGSGGIAWQQITRRIPAAVRRAIGAPAPGGPTAADNYGPIDNPMVFAAAAGGMSAEQERIWKQRRMAADPKYREKELKRLLADSEKRQKAATVRGKVDPQLKRARELLKKAGKLAVRDPKLAAKIARVAKIGGPSVLLSTAFEVGFYVGGKIYEKGSAWYYDEKPQQPPKVTGGKLSPVKITAKRIPEPRPAAGRPGGPVEAVSGAPRPTRLPSGKLEQIKVTAQRIPETKLEPIKITATKLPVPKTVPAWQRTLAKLYRTVQPSLQLYSQLRPLLPSRAAKPLSAVRNAPAVQLLPQTSPLTQLQPAAVQSRTCKPCKCAKPKRKSGKPRCRNPVVSRRKRTKDGRELLTTTRELRC